MDVRQRDGDPTDGLIRHAREAFVVALARGDARAASACYAPDARLLAPSATLFHGRGSVERYWDAGVTAGISAVEQEAIEVVRRDGSAFEIGRYALLLTPTNGPSIVDRGTYVRVHARQADGTWLWAVEIFNPAATSPRQGTSTEGGSR